MVIGNADKSANHWLQATRDFALLFILAHLPRVPEPKRWVKVSNEARGLVSLTMRENEL